MASEWFYEKDGEKLGPVSTDRLKDLAASGQLEPRNLVWKAGMEAWHPAVRLRGLFQGGTPPLPPSTSEGQPERGGLHETSDPTRTPPAKLRAGIFEAASRAARMARDVAGSDGVQEVLGRAGRAATEVGNKAKDAAQKTKDYANSDEAKELVDKAKRAASEAGRNAKDAAQKAKDYARSDEVQEAIGATRRHASAVGGRLATSLTRLGARFRGRWSRKQIVVGSASIAFLLLGLRLMSGGEKTGDVSPSSERLAKDVGGGGMPNAARTPSPGPLPGVMMPTVKPSDGAMVGERRLSPDEVIASIDPSDVSTIDYRKGPLGEEIVERSNTDGKTGLQTTSKGYIGTDKAFVKHGAEIEWFGSPKSGIKKKEVFFFDGKLHGTWTEWLKSGAKRVEMTYENNLARGLQVEYYEDGRIKKVIH